MWNGMCVSLLFNCCLNGLFIGFVKIFGKSFKVAFSLALFFLSSYRYTYRTAFIIAEEIICG